jgi:RNA polymerase sigma-70 factor, ECF subfamily
MYKTYTTASPPGTDRPESVLVRIAAGETQAVSECMDRYCGLVRSIVRLRVKNPADAEDAMQEIFVQVWKSAWRFDARIGPEAVFVATIARRKLIDRMRSWSRQPALVSLDEEQFEMEAHASMEAVASMDLDTAARALGQLAPDQRELVMMGVVHGLSHSEIARATGKPLGTVKAKMRRGLAKIRALLDSEQISDTRFKARVHRIDSHASRAEHRA